MLTKQYENIAYAITHFKEKNNFLTLFILIIGVILGAITFARIIELFFYFAPNATITLFSGFVLFSIPDLIKSEKIKPNLVWFFLGTLLIYFLSCIRIPTTPVIINYPKITILFLIIFTFFGILDGFFTILPGISGSMIMMILGPYFLYKSYLANLNIHNLTFLFPLFFYFIGDILGFFIGSKVSLYFLTKHRKKFLSLLLGMVVMSALILLPIHNIYPNNILLYVAVFLVSFILCQALKLIK